MSCADLPPRACCPPRLLYRVLIVRPDAEFRPLSWRNVPARYRVQMVALSQLPRWVALGWAQAFNRRELQLRFGLWAVVVPECSLAARSDDGACRPCNRPASPV